MFRHAIILILLSNPILAFSETITYYDCNRPDRTIAYRSEPCPNGEWEIKRQEVDISIYDNKDKEWVGMSDSGPLILKPDPKMRGNYTVKGTINGKPIVFMVDTGASYLSISSQMAATYGITDCTPGGKTSTANGVVDTCMGKAKNISFGNLQLSDAEVSIVPNLAGNALLGMNVLNKFRVDQSGSTMRISRQ
jgi:clan AA aspartic protease (TIGR02281 family)